MFNIIKEYFSKRYEKKVLTHPAVQKAFAEQEMINEWMFSLDKESNSIHKDFYRASQHAISDESS